MYRNSFVLGIKNSQGAILRESDDTVYLPFNSEYSLYLRNNNSKRASVSIKIDGTDVLGGGRLMLNPNQPFDLKRFVLDGNFDTGKAFKFVSLLHPDVQNPMGKCNGRVDVEFRLEKYNFQIPTYYYPVVYPIWPPLVWINIPNIPSLTPLQPSWTYCAGSTTSSLNSSTIVASTNSTSGDNQSSTFQAGPKITPGLEGKKGATVEGQQVDQRFVSTTVGELEDTSTIISLQILAPNDVVGENTVEGTKKKYCTGCGKKLGFSDVYCSKCGTKQ